MRICFIDPVKTRYRVDSPEISSMGGTQAAACYLTRELAKLGHEVHLWTNTDEPGRVMGVDCRNPYRPIEGVDPAFDFVVVVSHANGEMIKQYQRLFPPGVRFILWSGHAHDQPASIELADPVVGNFWTAFALVSGWQAGHYAGAFGIDPNRIHIMRNAASPRFADVFTPDEDVLAAKLGADDGAITLAYASAPYRGLALAGAAFRLVKARIPEARLAVFSGPGAAEPDAQRADPLFNALLTMDGVSHVGSVRQAELAERLKSAAVLLYPNTFAETSCIAVMEAMAAGCRVLTSNLGALPETTAGFAVLKEAFKGDDVQAYVKSFADEACAQIDFLRASPVAGAVLRGQVDYSRYNSWTVRAHEWDHMLKRLAA